MPTVCNSLIKKTILAAWAFEKNSIILKAVSRKEELINFSLIPQQINNELNSALVKLPPTRKTERANRDACSGYDAAKSSLTTLSMRISFEQRN